MPIVVLKKLHRRQLRRPRGGQSIASAQKRNVKLQRAAGDGTRVWHTQDQELRAVSRQLIEAQETARRHLARELHDDIGQRLTGLNLLLDRTSTQASGTVRKGIRDARNIVVELLRHVRQTASSLRPHVLDGLGLLVALQAHVKEYHLRTGISVGFTWETFVENEVPAPIKIVAFRVVQEGLTNVARHAGVPHVALAVRIKESDLIITLCDLGHGFDPLVTGRNGGSGLTGMRERAILAGGYMRVESVPDRGTRICVRLPLRVQQKAKVK
jgi:signal transduction histidine kinase